MGDFKKSGNKDTAENKEIAKSEVQYISLNISGLDENTDELDIYEIFKTVWDEKKTVLQSIAVFTFLGLIIALLSIEEFTSNVKLLPESQAEVPLGRLGSLASQFGLSAVPQTSGDVLSSNLYPEIIRSNAFLIELMEYNVTLENSADQLKLKDYLANHHKSPLIKQVLMFPFSVKNWVTGDSERNISGSDLVFGDEDKINRLISMPKEEWELLRDLRQRISTSIDNETRVVTVSVKMQSPVIAADLADEIVLMLSDYVTQNRTEKARRDVRFIEERFDEAKIRFEKVQRELAEFNDANRGQLTAVARTEEQLLQSRYNLKFNLYNSMAERLEEARIKLQEDTPVINILDTAAIPDERSEPNRIIILILMAGLGAFTGLIIIFGKQFKKRLSN